MLTALYRVLTKLTHEIYRYVDHVGYARWIGVKVGRDCRLISTRFGSEPYLVTLGDRVSAAGVSFVTHDGAVWVFRDRHPDADLVAPIRVGNNVFIGAGSVVLPGVTIGDNTIVGAGSVVTRDIPPGSVAVGAPARVVRPIEDYWESIKDRTVPTHRLAPRAKRALLEKMFASGAGGTERGD